MKFDERFQLPCSDARGSSKGGFTSGRFVFVQEQRSQGFSSTFFYIFLTRFAAIDSIAIGNPEIVVVWASEAANSASASLLRRHGRPAATCHAPLVLVTVEKLHKRKSALTRLLRDAPAEWCFRRTTTIGGGRLETSLVTPTHGDPDCSTLAQLCRISRARLVRLAPSGRMRARLGPLGV